MNRILLWTAIAGIGLGSAFLSLAYALGGHDFDDLHLNLGLGPSCGDGNAQQRERHLAWNDADALELSLPGTVYWRGGEGSDVVVRGAPGLVAHVELKRGRLTLDCRGGRARDLEVTLPGRPFRRIGIAGSGKLVMEKVSQPELALSIAGSGNMRAQGTVDRMTISVAGSGDAKLGELAAKQVAITITGSGKVEAAPKDSADVNIAGSGDVQLLTRPASLRSNIAGSGRIRQAERNP
jgi:putative autotransporter adhesin-like protein